MKPGDEFMSIDDIIRQMQNTTKDEKEKVGFANPTPKESTDKDSVQLGANVITMLLLGKISNQLETVISLLQKGE